jgi:hypothetical protein
MQQWHNPKIAHFGVDTTIELKNITTSDNNGIWRDMLRLSSVTLFTDVVVIQGVPK